VGAAPIERIAALHRLTSKELLAQLSVPDAEQEVELLAARAEQSGMAIRVRAREALSACVDRLRGVIEDEQTSPSLLIRAAEFLEKIALMPPTEERPTNAPFHIEIHLSPRAATPTHCIEVEAP
jgi:hypothetical protein